MKLLFATIILYLASVITAQKPTCPTGEALIGGSCGKCPAGQEYFLVEGCVDCKAGYFKAEEGILACDNCAPNSFATPASTKCTKCPEGTALLQKGKCGSCSPGRYYNEEKARCLKCGVNTFQPYENIKRYCFKCSGDTNSLKGATKCTKCPTNKAVMNDGSCGSCPPGSHYCKYCTLCKLCPPSTFIPYENVRESCLKCSGDSNSGEGATKCIKCGHGEFLMSDGTCRKCPKGTGYDKSKLKCTKCGFNMYSKVNGVLQECMPCPLLTYANTGATDCFRCPDGQGLIPQNKSKGKCGGCPPGSSYNFYTAECSRCSDLEDEGDVSAGGINEYCEHCLDGTVPNKDSSACV